MSKHRTEIEHQHVWLAENHITWICIRNSRRFEFCEYRNALSAAICFVSSRFASNKTLFRINIKWKAFAWSISGCAQSLLIQISTNGALHETNNNNKKENVRNELKLHDLRSKSRQPIQSSRSELSCKQVANISPSSIVLTLPPFSQPLQ